MAKIGRWENFSSIPIGGFQDAIRDALKEYGDVIFQATEEGLTAAESVLIKDLKAATPGPKSTGEFKKGWKSTGKKYKLLRFVGNTKTVEGKNGEKIALANIFEYSTTRGNQFIGETLVNSTEEMFAAVVAEIKKEA